MMLTDRQIMGAIMNDSIGIEPFDYRMVQPASIDVRLGRTLLIHTSGFETDPKSDSTHHWKRIEMDDEGYVMALSDFILGSTYEHVTLSPRHAARFEGKSSLGRIGLQTHITAGFIDPGFAGHVTVELANVSRRHIRLYPGMKIGQLCFFRLHEPVGSPYGSVQVGSHYQGQSDPQPSRVHENFHQTEIPL